MTWKAILGQRVSAELDDHLREDLDVLEYDTETGDIYVAWPLVNVAVGPTEAGPMVRKTRVSASKYEPLDKKSWDEMVRQLDPDKSEKC